MATFAKALELLTEKGEMKRCYYLCGPDKVLVEELVSLIRDIVDPHDLDYASISAASMKPAEVFAHLNQYPLDAEKKRLVIIRDAERMKSWRPFEDWMLSRHIPQVVAVFVSNRAEEDTKEPHLVRLVKSGRFVKCGPLSADDAAAWIQRQAPMSASTAKHLLARVGGDLAAARDCAKKASLFMGVADERVIDVLTERAPEDDFVAALTAMDKKAALSALEAMPRSENSKAIGNLDYRLDVLLKIHTSLKRNASVRDVIQNTGIKGFLVKELMPHAKHYDRANCYRRWQALAFADTAQMKGAEVGPMEALVALW